MPHPIRRFRFALLATCGLSIACSKNPATPTGPTPSTDTVVYTAIGASDAVGIGSSVICLGTIDCPNATGYVYVLKRALQTGGKTVTFTNLGVPGAVLSSAIQTLSRQAGRSDIIANFIDNQVPFVGSNVTHVTVFAGGNDTNVIAQAVRAGLVGSDTPNDIRAYVDRQIQQWGVDFEEMIRRIRSRAPTARIVAYNLPNLAGLPYVASNTTLERSVLQRIAVGLADRVNAMATQNVLVIDLLCEARVYNPANLSSDGFHPNDQGYQLMADLGRPALQSGTASPPNPSCAQRTLFPVF